MARWFRSMLVFPVGPLFRLRERVIRCRFILSGKNGELTPDFPPAFCIPHFLERGSPQSMRVTWGSGPGYSENWRQSGRITVFEERRP